MHTSVGGSRPQISARYIASAGPAGILRAGAAARDPYINQRLYKSGPSRPRPIMPSAA